MPTIVAAVLVLATAGATGVVLVNRQKTSRPHGAATTSTQPSPRASSQVPQRCAWLPSSGQVKDVGTPPPQPPTIGHAVMTITTNRGVTQIALDAGKTPCAVASFTFLATQKFFEGSKCHRLVDEVIYVLQCGDPFGNGRGGPSYQYAEENLSAPAARTSTGPPADACVQANDPTAFVQPLSNGSCPPGADQVYFNLPSDGRRTSTDQAG